MPTTPRSSTSRPPVRAARVTHATAKRARTKTPATDDGAPLARYRAKRDFTVTSEPGPVRARPGRQRSFVIQKHDATRLHYDFRLELDGVLLSWAVPKGPSFDPKQKRLAVHVEDHPVAYGTFEGTIPPGQYGAGTVIVWDNGTWEPVGDPRAGMKAGKLVFRLHGRKVAGLWELVKIAKPGERQEPWLLFKKHDEWERPHAKYDVVGALPDSVVAHPLPLLDAPPGAAVGRSRKASAATLEAGESSAVAATAKAAGDKPAKTSRKPATAKASKLDPLALDGARKAALPETLSPQLATLAKSAPTHGDWLYEIKFDGYRLTTRIARGKATIITRGGHDWTAKLQPLADELATLASRAAGSTARPWCSATTACRASTCCRTRCPRAAAPRASSTTCSTFRSSTASTCAACRCTRVARCSGRCSKATAATRCDSATTSPPTRARCWRPRAASASKARSPSGATGCTRPRARPTGSSSSARRARSSSSAASATAATTPGPWARCRWAISTRKASCSTRAAWARAGARRTP